jgi:capsule polysaccharide export protein KpsE/RkpR
MTPSANFATLDRNDRIVFTPEPRWVLHARVLWTHRRMLAKVTGISLLISFAIASAIPKQYKSTTSIMPPDQQSSSAMMLAALSGRLGSLGALGSLAGGLTGAHSSADLFIDLLRSGTVSSHLIDRFNLQHVYRKRYRIDTAKHLAHLTKITEDKKSGVITIEVEDTDRERARNLAQGYLDELNQLVVQTNTSAAHRERVFIEQRLHTVQADLEGAELKLSRFSSDSNAIDIKEQTRAMVDAGAHVQAELIVEQSGLQSLKQIYGDANIRVRETEARISSLQAQLARMTGSSAGPIGESQLKSGSNGEQNSDSAELYPPLRALPLLAVPYADLYRRVQVQEAVFQLLTQQYETARIEQAKDVPPVNVIDPPGIPEKKSFPPRVWVTLLLTFVTVACTSTTLLARHYWFALSDTDPRKELAAEVILVLRRRTRMFFAFGRGAV